MGERSDASDAGAGFGETETVVDINLELDTKLKEDKLQTQRRLAMLSFATIIVVHISSLIFLVSGFMGIEEFNSFSGGSGMFYAVLAGVISLYMGGETWIAKK